MLREHAGVFGARAVGWLLGFRVPPEGRAHVDAAPVGPLPDAPRLVVCADPEVASGQPLTANEVHDRRQQVSRVDLRQLAQKRVAEVPRVMPRALIHSVKEEAPTTHGLVGDGATYI